ncbi:c-type cytochrome [Sagittula salina]
MFSIVFLAMAIAAGPGQAQDAGVGEDLYRRHCATCHGLEARGDGPMAGAMVLKPNNLRDLTAANAGVFPLERVIKRIDGRDPLVSHGSPMPVYGDFFEGSYDVAMKTHTGQPILASQPVVDLVTYLLEIQRQE